MGKKSSLRGALALCLVLLLFAFSVLPANAGNNRPRAGFTYSPRDPTTSDNIQFTDNSTDNDGTIISWSWNFGDNTTRTLQNPTHRYSSAGTYTVTLEVTDNDNRTDNTSKNIMVRISTTLTISPQSFTLQPRKSENLTATLRDNENKPLPGKTVVWSATAGTLSSENGVTDNQGLVTVTYTAPDNETEVTVTASFADDNWYGESRSTCTVTVQAEFPWLAVLAAAVAGGAVAAAAYGLGKRRRAAEKPEGRLPAFVGQRSDAGRVRTHNEDSTAVLAVPGSGRSGRAMKVLAIVADGMGGHAKGEVASKTAAEEIIAGLKPLLSERRASAKEYKKALRESFGNANREIIDYALNNPECTGMGTTASAAVIDDGMLHVAHVGDTRVYVIDGGIEQVTKDHSLVQELVDKGEITPEEARKHPKKNVITRAIGIGAELEVDTYSKTLVDGSYVLVCCDGLVNEVGDEEIRETVLGSRDPQEACDRLVNLANKNGGRDNISVIVVGPVKGIPAAELGAETVVRKKPKS